MKKLDKLVLKSFLGPFILTFVVVVFILLLQYMLKYFDDLVGKGLGFEVFAELMTSFSIVMTPNALPLAILLSSLMTFGNLGEHFELTAIKSAGISLLRTMAPIFYFTIFLTAFAFFSNNNIVPKAALNAYSLMYDVRQQKPSLSIKEGAFYNGIQNFTIRVNEKDPKGDTMKDLMIYDHTKRRGNVEIIMADSGRMYSFMNDRYLVMELYDGHRYQQSDKTPQKSYSKKDIEPYIRTKFSQTKMIFSLEDFDLKKTKKELFANNRLMKNIRQLNVDIDSMDFEVEEVKYKLFKNAQNYYNYHLDEKIVVPEKYEIVGIKLDSIRKVRDSIQAVKDGMYEERYTAERELEKSRKAAEKKKKKTPPKETVAVKSVPANKHVKKLDKKVTPIFKKPENQKKKKPTTVAGKNKKADTSKPKEEDKEVHVLTMEEALSKVDSTMALEKNKTKVMASALTKARQMKNQMVTQDANTTNLVNEARKYKIEKNKKIALALACLSMFLIGAPLGAIIKKGGLGVPVIISIIFFITFYVINITGEKLAKQGIIEPWVGAWAANFILFPIGLFFLRQARIDARVFDVDFYNVFVGNIRRKFSKNKS
ncbi:LptF/LptG family permease [Fulvivirgaceae bacterium BMA12]|uniref:LptF/LptG family permease n=1 Tax=Agaribacillus aureus TaxID=3051825 RepID=A0ABT8KYH7_9BACT|nr:LptF/LptG family permease [Fulvivirgaceae bacterium BMA12]